MPETTIQECTVGEDCFVCLVTAPDYQEDPDGCINGDPTIAAIKETLLEICVDHQEILDNLEAGFGFCNICGSPNDFCQGHGGGEAEAHYRECPSCAEGANCDPDSNEYY